MTFKNENVEKGLFRKELERFTIELAWKSSSIEGNTYNELETEQLIKNGIPAPGKTEEEARMILNHKYALDFILKDLKKFEILNLADILELHQILTNGLEVDSGIRKHAVRIAGTKYVPPKSESLLREYLIQICKIVNQKKHPVEKALITSICLAYLQPFGDGNKRTSRMIGNAILLAFGYSAISYRAVSDIDYKKAVILFDETQNLYLYKQVFLSQYYFASENYLI